MFVVGLYMSAKLHKHVESIGGVSKDLLPPQPDPGLFAPAAMATQHGDPSPHKDRRRALQLRCDSICRTWTATEWNNLRMNSVRRL